MEIVFRAAVMYVFLWIVTRATGKATLGELSTFQLVFYIVLGDLIQQGVTLQDYSVTGAVLAISVFAVLTVAVSWANLRWPRARPLIHGAPVVVVSDGEMRGDLMQVERLSVDDLYEAARANGIERMSQVRLAVLEADGQISFFKRDGEHEEPRRRPEH
ncbi:MAG TPA: YetF domain-containing protein [Actinomycetales bacterium]|nr:YetF domain-containing protein [Actinomycetales bacterium]